jgi:hypothetical protein
MRNVKSRFRRGVENGKEKGRKKEGLRILDRTEILAFLFGQIGQNRVFAASSPSSKSEVRTNGAGEFFWISSASESKLLRSIVT